MAMAGNGATALTTPIDFSFEGHFMLRSVLERRGIRGAILGAVLVALVATGVKADPTAPSANDRYVAKEVVHLLADHLSKHPFDAEIAKRMVHLFLKSLDPLKMYFYQSDVDSLTNRQGELMEKVRRGDVAPAFTIFSLYLQRLDERVAMVEQLLAMPHDFTVEEDMIIDREAAQYPVSQADAQDKWRKRIKYELLMLKVDKGDGKKGDEKGLEGPAAIEKLKRRYQSLSKRMHQTNNQELLEMYLTALTSSFDPHSSYMSPDTMANFSIVMRLELEGIGAALQSTDGYTVVNKLIPGGAAEKDGRLKVEDKVLAVGQGTEGEMVDVVDMKLSDVVKMIRGKRGTVVRLQVLSSTNEKKTIAITREKIELKDSEARSKIFEAGQRPDGQPYRIGVIDLPSFYGDMDGARQGLLDYRSTTRDVRKLLDEFNKQNVDAVVLDLRRNGGGFLTEAINLTGLFIEEGPVVQVKGPDGTVQPYKDTDAGVTWSKPLVVLTSKFSASASEILAGAIQDYRRGLVVGDHTTHGKGTVQSVMDIGQQLFRIPNAPSLGALKITVQQFYRPNGDSTQNRGVVADVELPALTTHLDVGEADLDYPLAFDHVNAQRFRQYGQVSPALVAALRARSEARTVGSEDFKKVLRNITRYQEQKKRKSITLNEKKFMEERAELNADKEEEKKIEEMQNADKNGIERNFYMNEVLNLTADYLTLLPQINQLQFAGSQPAAATPAAPAGANRN